MDEHTPVLASEVLAALALRPTGLYVDATFGRGGHSERILAALGGDGRLIALDRDPEAIAAGQARFAHEQRLCLVHAAFDQLAAVVHAHSERTQCDGIVFDLGVASPQLDAPERGFSFRLDGPLDMRLDPSRGQPVSAWLAHATRAEIAEVIAHYGEERFAGRIATEIVRARGKAPLTRTAELAGLVARCVRTRERGRHPATRTFQALRIYVNDELGQIERALPQTLDVLAPGGRLAVISFHSLEDRIVKHFIRDHSQRGGAGAPALQRVGRKLRPSEQEMAANPRSRSALLRVAERLA